MSAYTAGPWNLDRRSENLLGSNGNHVQVYGSGLSFAGLPDAESVANSKLIAAAPELLEALKKSEKLLRNLMSAVGGNDKLSGCEEFYKGYNAVTRRVAGQAAEIFVEVSAAIAKAEGK